MKHILAMAAVTALLATSASAGPPESCCACVADFDAQASGPPPPGADAFFCAQVDSPAAQDAFSNRCQALDGVGICVAMVAQTQAAAAGLNCGAILQDELGIACPANRAVPVANHWWLAGLTAAMVAGGAWLVRRGRITAARTA